MMYIEMSMFIKRKTEILKIQAVIIPLNKFYYDETSFHYSSQHGNEY
jgi:hypothetical protein